MHNSLITPAADVVLNNSVSCIRASFCKVERKERLEIFSYDVGDGKCRGNVRAKAARFSGGKPSRLRAFDVWHEAEVMSYEVTADGHLIPFSTAIQETEGRMVWENLAGFTPQSESDWSDAGEMKQASLWAKLGQRLNLAGIVLATKIAVREQHLAIPHVSVQDIRWINWSALRKRGFEGVVFDKDNTLTAPYKLTVWPSLVQSLEECKSVFQGRVALLSNSAGLNQYDPDGSEAKKLESVLNISVIRHDSKKPGGHAEEIASFFGCEPSLLVMVGDRYFTDVVYGNRNGLLTIRPAPLTMLGEPFIVQQVRKVEESLVHRWCKNGIMPSLHKLCTDANDFIQHPSSL